MTLAEAKSALCNTKLNISLTDVAAGLNSLFVLQDILDALNFGVMKAWDYKPWTFTQGHAQVTTPTPTVASYTYPDSFEDESIFFIAVNGIPWSGPNNGKRNFLDYQKFLSDYPTDPSLIWAEYARQYYLNQAAYSVGQTVDLYGKKRYTKLASDSDLLPFSSTTDPNENSGNQAIVKLAYAFLLSSEKKKNPQEALAQEKSAYADLDVVWKPMGERRAEMQSQNRPFFNTQDNFAARATRFNTNIGNFP